MGSWHHMQCQGMLDALQCGTSFSQWHCGPKWQLVVQQSSSFVISVSQPNIKWISGQLTGDLPRPIYIGFRVLADIIDQKSGDRKTVAASLPVPPAC